MFENAKEFFDGVFDEFDDLREKIDKMLFKELPDLIEKWDFNSRPLDANEIREARKVFRDKLNYDKIKIIEGNELPNFLDDLGRIIKKCQNELFLNIMPLH